jgi:hypothetical protein
LLPWYQPSQIRCPKSAFQFFSWIMGFPMQGVADLLGCPR